MNKKLKTNMKRALLFALLVAVACTFTSCKGTIRKMRRKVQIERIDAMRVESLSRVEIDFAVKNGTAYKLHLDKAVLTLRYKEATVATMTLRDKVEIPRRSEGVVTSCWWIDVQNPLAMLSVVAKLQSDPSQATVDVSLEGRGGPVPVNISREKMPLSVFLNTFGVDITAIKNLL